MQFIKKYPNCPFLCRKNAAQSIYYGKWLNGICCWNNWKNCGLLYLTKGRERLEYCYNIFLVFREKINVVSQGYEKIERISRFSHKFLEKKKTQLKYLNQSKLSKVSIVANDIYCKLFLKSCRVTFVRCERLMGNIKHRWVKSWIAQKD